MLSFGHTCRVLAFTKKINKRTFVGFCVKGTGGLRATILIVLLYIAQG